MAKVVQINVTANGHIVALDDSGTIWWRPWNKKGWGKLEAVPVASDTPPVSTPPTTPPTPVPPSLPPAVTPSAILPATAVPSVAVPSLNLETIPTPSSIHDPA